MYNQLIIATGLHWGILMVAIADLVAGTPNFLFPLFALAPLVQAATTLAISLKTKDEEVKGTAIGVTIPGIFGTTEPGLYGITLPNIKYFIITSISCALSGVWIGLSGTVAYQMSGVGILVLPAMISPDGWGSMINFIIAALIGILFSFITTFLLYKDDVKIEVN